LLKLTTETQLN